jgi:hypothetical protein
MSGAWRVWILALVAVGVWWLCGYASTPHKTVDASAPATAFSSARADDTLGRVLGPEKPHPVSSAENAAVRGRILKEFAALGVPARTYQAFTCNAWRGFGYVACATVIDIVAEVVPGQGKAIVMMAHYDSVPAGPGASDDESGVATVLETTRALKAANAKSLHPVIALITDGEEAGLLGANAFLQNAALKARVGAVVNVEARGTKGPSLLFQTSPGDGRLIDLYAAHVPTLATSSLYAEIYKYLPNDTDLTLFIRDGFPSFNFAFADNVRYYHSPFDLRRNLDPATLQMHGDNLLGVVSGLEQTDYAALKGGNDVYMSVLGVALPRIASSWALPLAIAVFIVLLVATLLAPAEAEGSTWLAALMPLALLFGAIALGFGFAIIVRLITGMPDPTYAYPAPMRIALAAGVWTITMLVSRMVTVRGAAASAWLWMSGLGIVVAATLPGLSPYFVFPSLIAAVLLLATARAPGGWTGTWGQIALFVSALGAMIVWIALIGSGETLMGLQLHPLFTIPAAFAMMTVVPLLVSREKHSISVFIFDAIALVGLIVACFMPAYSKESPRRIDLIYFQNDNGSHWIANTAWKAKSAEPLPEALQNAGGFKLDNDAYPGLGMGDGYTVSASAQGFTLPTATVVKTEKSSAVRFVTLTLHGSANTDGMTLYIPKAAKLRGIDLRGQHLVVPPDWSGATRLLCVSRDCRDETVKLTLAGDTSGLVFVEDRYGLPAFGDKLKAARPDTAMPSQSGDEVMLASKIKLP